MPDSDLLERMRRSKTGWTAGDLERLYVGFGFRWREGHKHRFYVHPRHPDLYTTVTRSSHRVAPGYVQTAVRLIDNLQRRGG